MQITYKQTHKKNSFSSKDKALYLLILLPFSRWVGQLPHGAFRGTR